MGQLGLCFEPPAVELTPAQVAIICAQRGDWGPANQMELDYLNNPENCIFPGVRQSEDGDGFSAADEVKAYRIDRHDDGLHVMWVTPAISGDTLHACDHRNADDGLAINCRDCEGTGWRATDCAPLISIETDIDGRIIVGPND